MPLYDESSLFIGNLNYKCLEFEVEEYFGHVAPVKSVTLCKLESGAPKGVGYVTFFNREDAIKALKALDRLDFQGRKLFLKLASDPITPKENKPAMNPENTNKRREISFLIDKFKEETDETIKRQIAFVVGRDLHMDESDSIFRMAYEDRLKQSNENKDFIRREYDKRGYRNSLRNKQFSRDSEYRDRSDIRRDSIDYRDDRRCYNGYRNEYRSRDDDDGYRPRYNRSRPNDRDYYLPPMVMPLRPPMVSRPPFPSNYPPFPPPYPYGNSFPYR